MPLIKCQACGKEISSFAASCPDCGMSVELSLNILNRDSIVEKLKKLSYYNCFFDFTVRNMQVYSTLPNFLRYLETLDYELNEIILNRQATDKRFLTISQNPSKRVIYYLGMSIWGGNELQVDLFREVIEEESHDFYGFEPIRGQGALFRTYAEIGGYLKNPSGKEGVFFNFKMNHSSRNLLKENTAKEERKLESIEVSLKHKTEGGKIINALYEESKGSKFKKKVLYSGDTLMDSGRKHVCDVPVPFTEKNLFSFTTEIDEFYRLFATLFDLLYLKKGRK